MSLPDTLMLGTGLLAFLYLISRVITKTIWPEMRPQLPIYGDYPSLPEEMRRGASKSTPGGRADSAPRAQTRTDDIAHRNETVTR
jgi:hypothetical protein